MDVLLFYPRFPLGRKKWIVGGWSNRMYPPLDMGWIGKLLENEGNIKFKVIDANANRYSDEKIKNFLKKFKPKIVLTTSETYDLYRCMSLVPEFLSIYQKNIELIKNTLHESTVILIGPHGTALPDEVFRENPKLDIIVRGEPEVTSVKVIEAILNNEKLENLEGISFRKNGNIVHNENRPFIENLDDLSYPAYHLLEMEKYLEYHKKVENQRRALIVSSRGCPFNCIYCFKAMSGNNFRARSAENVLEEIDFLYKNYHIEGISFWDDIFTFDQERVGKICRGLKNRNYDLKWECETRIETVSKSLLKEMAESGCVSICFGIESLLPRVQKTAQKQIDIKKIKEIVKYAEKSGIIPCVAFQLGLPGDSWGAIDENLKMMKKLDVLIDLPLITRVYPTTKLYNMAKEDNFIKKGNFQECINASALVRTGFKDREDYYKALRYYHKEITRLNLRKKITLNNLVKKIRMYGLFGSFKKGITVLKTLLKS